MKKCTTISPFCKSALHQATLTQLSHSILLLLATRGGRSPACCESVEKSPGFNLKLTNQRGSYAFLLLKEKKILTRYTPRCIQASYSINIPTATLPEMRMLFGEIQITLTRAPSSISPDPQNCFLFFSQDKIFVYLITVFKCGISERSWRNGLLCY